MSEYDNPFEENLRDNGALLATVGHMAQLSNQRKLREESRKQTALLEEQARKAEEKANAEKARLEIEKQRLALERQEMELRAEEARQVKEMRKAMSGLSREVDEILAQYA